jgi:ABC-type Co2+ transport system permease subunit
VTTLIVMAVITVLLIAAVWRQPDQVTWILVGCFAAAVIIATKMPATERFTTLALIDYALVAVMIGPWAVKRCGRARIIGVIGLAKLVARLTYASNPYIDHWTFAAIMNCAFAAQVIVAGGLADGIGCWISDRRLFGRTSPAGLHRNGAEQ